MELTGAENVELYGSIMGLSRDRLARHYEEIVSFAGIGKFIDTPVKYYSSGMVARLAFSVAVNGKPDILLLDEVLAVGDQSFQEKCLDRLRSFPGRRRDHGGGFPRLAHRERPLFKGCLARKRFDTDGRRAETVVEAYRDSVR